MIDAQIIRYFRGRRVVVLSPHFDDACFSLGEFLFRLGGGDLINIFTQGDYMARGRDKNHPAFNQEYVYAIRDAEDAAFAEACGLRRHDVGCEEPSLRGRRPSVLEHLDDDLGQMGGLLPGALQNVARDLNPGEKAVLMAPLGIGRHVNHRATAAWVLNHLGVLQMLFDVFLYEDLPYAGSPFQRIAAINRARRKVQLGARYALRNTGRTKEELISHYRSQLKGRARLSRFWPKAWIPFAPHEAFWLAIGPKPETRT